MLCETSVCSNELCFGSLMNLCIDSILIFVYRSDHINMFSIATVHAPIRVPVFFNFLLWQKKKMCMLTSTKYYRHKHHCDSGSLDCLLPFLTLLTGAAVLRHRPLQKPACVLPALAGVCVAGFRRRISVAGSHGPAKPAFCRYQQGHLVIYIMYDYITKLHFHRIVPIRNALFINLAMEGSTQSHDEFTHNLEKFRNLTHSARWHKLCCMIVPRFIMMSCFQCFFWTILICFVKLSSDILLCSEYV